MKINEKIYTIDSLIYESTNKFIINTNHKQEELLNKAMKAHKEKNIKEACKYYELLIKNGFTNPIVYSNYAVICIELGNPKKAKQIYHKSIKLFPNNYNSYANLGALLRDSGQPKEAETYIRKALEIKSDHAESYMNLGLLSIDLYKLQDAEYFFKKAIKYKSNYLDAHIKLGMTLVDLKKYDEAFNSFLKSTKIFKNSSYIFFTIARSLYDSNPSFINHSLLRKTIKILLERNDVSHEQLFVSFNYIYRNELKKYTELFNKNAFKDDSFENIINDSILIKALEKIIFLDSQWESILIKIREYICINLINKKIVLTNKTLKFTCALAKQCFLNEYVYYCHNEELRIINEMINLLNSEYSNYENLSIICCYYPLYKIWNRLPLIKSKFILNKNLYKIYIHQFKEPIKEIELSKTIRRVINSNNKISQLIKTQYEENPYPRWINENSFKDKKFSYINIINSEIKPNSIKIFLDCKELNILIAGCGTGQQILHAQRYKNARITGIDLSATSLAFTQRKINEMEINNVELIQMDILDIHLLKKRFDIIECGGVLHHMDVPSDGLNALLNVLKQPGYLKLGLYSQIARKDIINIRKYLKENDIGTSTENIINFRHKVISGELKEFNNLTKRGDFYSTSSCRDLCFNAKEHRFNINQLIEIIKMNKLEFMGFQVPNTIQLLYKDYNPR